VPLGGSTVEAPELNASLVEGGVDWQGARSDGVLDITAHDMIRTPGGALVEVQSKGLRHGPPEGMARGHPDCLHLNKVMALAVGQREARRVLLDLSRLI
jgi:hypothetical protein